MAYSSLYASQRTEFPVNGSIPRQCRVDLKVRAARFVKMLVRDIARLHPVMTDSNKHQRIMYSDFVL